MRHNGKTYRNCDECAKPKSCNIIYMRQINDYSKNSYVFYVCDNCLATLRDIGEPSEQLLKSVDA